MPRFFIALLALVLSPSGAFAAQRGSEVIVVFNSSMPESRDVATHYASKRQVPPDNLIGLDLPKEEVMSRAEFDSKLQAPLLAALEKRGFWKFGADSEFPTESSVRFAALCYGVPLKVSPATDLKEKEVEGAPKELQRNEASVEGELALLPLNRGKHLLRGPLKNAAYGQTNRAALHPTNGVFLVTRLDGPTPEIAKSLVDKAMVAEREGLWGRGYFDARGLQEGEFVPGDDNIRRAANICVMYGIDVLMDNGPATLSAATPLSHIAVYAGWYDQQVSGPFAKAVVDFMPGAIAYHLHSFSASSVRSPTDWWVGPLLAKGATVAFGTVYEPYLAMTPNLGIFHAQLLLGGFTLGEAAVTCQEFLSWQTTFVGDPLYQPLNKSFRAQMEGMIAAQSPYLDWGHIKILNLGGATNAAQMAGYLREQPTFRRSAVLQEKLGDAYHAAAGLFESIGPYELALKNATNAPQRLRLSLRLGDLYGIFGRHKQAFEVYESMLKAEPDYPNKLSIYKQLADLAATLGRAEDVEKYKAEIARLEPAAKPEPPRGGAGNR